MRTAVLSTIGTMSIGDDFLQFSHAATLLQNRGLDAGIEFYDEDFTFPERSPDSVVYARYPWSCGLQNIIAAIIGGTQFSSLLHVIQVWLGRT